MEHDAFVKDRIEALRKKLIDLTNRNRLTNFTHSDRSRKHLRIVDELPDVVLDRLPRWTPKSGH